MCHYKYGMFVEQEPIDKDHSSFWRFGFTDDPEIFIEKVQLGNPMKLHFTKIKLIKEYKFNEKFTDMLFWFRGKEKHLEKAKENFIYICEHPNEWFKNFEKDYLQDKTITYEPDNIVGFISETLKSNNIIRRNHLRVPFMPYEEKYLHYILMELLGGMQ